MEDAASEILGYHNSLYYHDEEAVTNRKHFNITYSDSIAQVLRNEESKDILSYMNGWNEINTIEKSKLPQQRSNALF